MELPVKLVLKDLVPQVFLLCIQTVAQVCPQETVKIPDTFNGQDPEKQKENNQGEGELMQIMAEPPQDRPQRQGDRRGQEKIKTHRPAPMGLLEFIPKILPQRAGTPHVRSI